MRVALIFNSFCFVRGSFWASGEALHGAPLAEPVNPPKSSKTCVFPRFGVKFAQKPRFWLQNASKPRIFLRFGFRVAQKHAFFHVLASNLLKNACFFHVFGFKMHQNNAFFYVLGSELLKNTRFSTFWLQNCSKTRVFPRFWLQNKTVRFSTFWLQNCSKTRVFQCFCLQSGSKLRVFPSFGFNIVQKHAFTKFFRYKLLQLFFDVFGLKRFKKTHSFFHAFCFKILQCKVYFFKDRRLCTQVLRARKLLHTDDLHTDNLHTDSFVQQTALHT